jgi:prepilin-type N-terminal cleavage/methylation domain-containing protein
MTTRTTGRRGGFTLIELLGTIAVMGVCVSLMMPSLGAAREAGRSTACTSNLRQMTLGWTMYANTWQDRAMPLAYTRSPDVPVGGESIYWWGTHGTTVAGVDHAKGFLSPYLDGTLSVRSVYECPSQAWGSYTPQGNPDRPEPTSTFGYNGYYLTPSRTPGWDRAIGFRPWRRLFEIPSPASLLVFADTLLPGSPPSNCALLDPPLLYARRAWTPNPAPTTAFRHHARRSGDGGSAGTARADGSVRHVAARAEWLTHPSNGIGSAGLDNELYVPDAASWR